MNEARSGDACEVASLPITGSRSQTHAGKLRVHPESLPYSQTVASWKLIAWPQRGHVGVVGFVGTAHRRSLESIRLTAFGPFADCVPYSELRVQSPVFAKSTK